MSGGVSIVYLWSRRQSTYRGPLEALDLQLARQAAHEIRREVLDCRKYGQCEPDTLNAEHVQLRRASLDP